LQISKKEKSPLTHGLNYRSDCDTKWHTAILRHWRIVN